MRTRISFFLFCIVGSLLFGCGGGGSAPPPNPLPGPFLLLSPGNEAIDLEVYALAALYTLGSAFAKKLGDFADRLREPLVEEEPAQEEEAARPTPRNKKKQTNWAYRGWKE